MQQKTLLENIIKYDSINQIEAAMLLSGITNTKSTLFKEALDRVDRAINIDALISQQAVTIAKKRGHLLEAYILHFKKLFPLLFVNEKAKQTVIKTRDFIAWSKVKNKEHLDRREKKALLKIIGVMANKLGLNDSNAVSKLKINLDFNKASLDVTTIRKHLKASKEILREVAAS